MDIRTIAEVIYEMSKDMDWADYKDLREADIAYLMEELETIKDMGLTLFDIIETIAEENVGILTEVPEDDE